MRTTKNLLLLLLAIPTLLQAQHSFNNRYVFGPGEYLNGFVDLANGGKLYQYTGAPQYFSGLGDNFVSTAGGAHHMLAVNSSGNVKAWGDNTSNELGDGTTTSRNTPVAVPTDSLGNPFTNVVKVMCGGSQTGWTSAAIKSDGTLWAWGALGGGDRGNNTYGGTTSRPVQIPFPAGTFIVDAAFNIMCMALDSAGNVWTWGGENIGGGFWTPYILAQGVSTGFHTRVPTKITLPVKIRMIAGGYELNNYAIGVNNHVYAWAYNMWYVGVRGKDLSNYGYKPADVTDSLGLPGIIDTIVCNNMSTGVILTDSTAYMWGDNSCSNMGNGPGIDFRHYRSGNTPGGFASPWGWDGGMGEAMQYKPIQLAKGKHNFTKLFASLSYCFEWYAEDVHDSVYSWGRNKYQVQNQFQGEIDSVAEVLGSTYPNNWDDAYIRPNYPFRTNKVVRSTGRICKDSAGQYCSNFPWDGSKAGPTAIPGSNQSISASYTVLKGSSTIASGVSGRTNTLWTQLSGPTTATIPIRTGDTVAVGNLTTGTYTFKYWVEDANFKTDSSTMTVTVSSGGVPPTVSAGANQSIATPATSTTLTGTATGNGGATITGVAWTQVSGPNTATIGSATSLTTTVSGLVLGVYVFKLTATDSNSNTNNANVTVTVVNCNCLTYGRGHQIFVK